MPSLSRAPFSLSKQTVGVGVGAVGAGIGTGVGMGIGTGVGVGIGTAVGAITPCQTPVFAAAITVPSAFTAIPLQYEDAEISAWSQVTPASPDTWMYVSESLGEYAATTIVSPLLTTARYQYPSPRDVHLLQVAP
jgi:hypothetical protein